MPKVKNNPNQSLLRIGGLLMLWGLPAALFSMNASASLLQMSGVGALVWTLIWVFGNLKIAPLSIPFAAVFGPIVRLDVIGGEVMLADVYLLGLLFILPLKGRLANFRPAYASLYSIRYPLLIILLFAVAISKTPSGSFVALTQLAALYFIYVLTLNCTQAEDEIGSITMAWVVATCAAAVVMLYFYSQGIYLIEFYDKGESERTIGANFFFRATYIYSGFHFLVGGSVLIVLVRLMKQGTIAEKVVYTLLLTFLVFTSVMMNIKTTIYAVILVGGYFATRSVLRMSKGKALSFTMLLLLVGAIFVQLILGNVSEDQLNLLFLRFESSDSLSMRNEVYPNVVKYLFDHPLSFLFGVGPGITNRYDVAQDQELSQIFGMEHAIDSSYLTFLFEYGVVLLASVMYVLAEVVVKLRRSVDWSKWSASKDVQVVLLYWALTAFTQLCGISKNTWLLAQVVGLAHWIVRSTYQSGIRGPRVQEVVR